jgi:hypothetical protein
VAANAVKLDEVKEVHVVDEEDDVVVEADAHLILRLMNFKKKLASSTKRRKLQRSKLNLKTQMMVNQIPNRLLVLILVKMLMLLRSGKNKWSAATSLTRLAMLPPLTHVISGLHVQPTSKNQTTIMAILNWICNAPATRSTHISSISTHINPAAALVKNCKETRTFLSNFVVKQSVQARVALNV